MPRSGSNVDPVLLEFQLAVAGRFSIERELGRGGMGIVYLAREVQLDRLVAIKVLPPDRVYDDERRTAFLREARMAARLSHPHIVQIFTVDEVEQFVFYTMAYVDGETVGDRVRARGPLPVAEGSRLLREVAWALGHAHANGLVHRDVKPENILIERGSGRALVTDFGIAAAGEPGEDTAVVGTPEYMSPEQTMGKPVDARSDLYALGATAFFVFTGRPPFQGARPVDVLAQQVASPVPVLSAAGAAVPRRVASLIETCLAKEPESRPTNASVFAERLDSAVEVRRDVPPALRAFVKREGRFGGGTVALTAYFGFSASMTLLWVAGPVTSLLTAVTVFGLAPFSVMAMAARRLLRLGFDRRDLETAFHAEVATLREEHLATGRSDEERSDRRLRWVTYGGLGASLVMGLGANFVPSLAGLAPFVPVGISLAVLGLAGRAILRSRRPHAGADTWRKIWSGPVGKAAFAVAKFFGAKPTHQVSTTHRPTELAIGMAAEQLYASLPAATRASLRDVPGLLTKLQRDAGDLRERLATTDRALEVGASVPVAERAPFEAHRDELAKRLRDVTAVLESTRLNLLRLHAGAMEVQSVTGHFDDAAKLSDEVRRLLEARGEVERFLRFPAAESRTPA